ncbi:MAG TPA: hypothetical protein HPP87_10030 [Planctomycetes bacterium]|nr:hypothetical protein [Planctomycetota bacterium]
MAKKLSAPKTDAWDWFSKWVRVKDCLETTGFPFVGECVTCGRRFHISFLQAGHCFPGRKNARLFQEELVHAQCRFCNEGKHGCPTKYRKIMEKRYTPKEVEKWEIEGKRFIHDRDMDFEGIAKKYKDKLDKLLRGCGYYSYEELLGNR